MNKVATRREQNEITNAYLDGSDLGKREQEVLRNASERTGFVSSQLIGRSGWWGSSEIGAFHYAGNYKDKKSVLKIQGVKPSVSEIYMIKSFSKTNKSEVIRPPYLYASLPWSDKSRYEALVMEYIDGSRVVQIPSTLAQVKKFFELYKEYRGNCFSTPWVDKPEKTISESIGDNFKRWREISFKIYPEHPFRKDDDKDLIDAAVKILRKGYSNVQPEFMHGHFSDGDLYQVGHQFVVLSNLYWSWRPPLYDAVFGYHWFIYHLGDVDKITPGEIEKQRTMWLGEIKSLPQAQGEAGSKLLNLALLERAAAGLNLDALSSDPKKPISRYLVDATRVQLKSLLEKLN